MQSPLRSRHVTALAWRLGSLTVFLAAAPAASGAQQLSVSRPAAVVRFTSAAAIDVDALPAALRQPITLRLERVSTERALQEVMDRAGLTLTYSRAVVPLDRVVSVDVAERSVLEALRQVLGGTEVELWVSTDGRMALVPAERTRRDARVVQTGVISGTVRTAESGAPLPEATVTLRGGAAVTSPGAPAVSVTRFGAVTAADGRYAIRGVPPGSYTVQARRLGYSLDSTRVTVVADQTVTADFTLRMLAVQLAPVQIGYGVTTRRDLTGAVSSVSSEEIERVPVTSVDQTLAGRAPGVEVVSASGQPGAGAMVARARRQLDLRGE